MGGFMKWSMMVIMMVASMQMHSTMAQTRHVVGDALGWTIPPNAAAYTTWASQQTFRVGDTLFFNFTTGFHNVAEVTQAAFGPCTTANPTTLTTTGPATVTLTTAGPHYYICTVGTHCQIGQKLSINVSAAAAAPTTPPPSPTPTTPPSATPTPSPTTAPVTPPAGTPTPTPSPTPAPATAPPIAAVAPTPAGATPPAPETSGPSPASDVTPPPPPPSAASRSLTAAVAPVTLLGVALALFY